MKRGRPAGPLTYIGGESSGVPGLAEGSRVDVGSAVRYPNDDVRGVAQLVDANKVQPAHLSGTNHHLCMRGGSSRGGVVNVIV